MSGRLADTRKWDDQTWIADGTFVDQASALLYADTKDTSRVTFETNVIWNGYRWSRRWVVWVPTVTPAPRNPDDPFAAYSGS